MQMAFSSLYLQPSHIGREDGDDMQVHVHTFHLRLFARTALRVLLQIAVIRKVLWLCLFNSAIKDIRPSAVVATMFFICAIFAVLVAVTLKDLRQTHTHVPTGKLAERATFCHRPGGHHGCFGFHPGVLNEEKNDG